MFIFYRLAQGGANVKYHVAKCDQSHYCLGMKTPSEALADEIAAVAAQLNLSTSTVSERVGQGGKFYDRLRAGSRAWPETIDTVKAKLRDLEASRSKGAA